MDITSAEFVVSNSRADMCPQTHLPEYAFIGRSNVGKSSLINMLTKNPKLAMTSATPGKTLLINHFLINKEWYLVDLPGYGYAQRGKKMMEKIQKLIEYYVLERGILRAGTGTDDLPVRPHRQPVGTAAHRPGIHRVAGRKRHPLRPDFHQSRQAERGKDEGQRKPLPGHAERTMGRAAPAFHLVFREQDRTTGNPRLHRTSKPFA